MIQPKRRAAQLGCERLIGRAGGESDPAVNVVRPAGEGGEGASARASRLDGDSWSFTLLPSLPSQGESRRVSALHRTSLQRVWNCRRIAWATGLFASDSGAADR